MPPSLESSIVLFWDSLPVLILLLLSFAAATEQEPASFEVVNPLSGWLLVAVPFVLPFAGELGEDWFDWLSIATSSGVIVFCGAYCC